jgi:hypothetical protein
VAYLLPPRIFCLLAHKAKKEKYVCGFVCLFFFHFANCVFVIRAFFCILTVLNTLSTAIDDIIPSPFFVDGLNDKNVE